MTQYADSVIVVWVVIDTSDCKNCCPDTFETYGGAEARIAAFPLRLQRYYKAYPIRIDL